MTLKVSCPKCQKILKAKESLEGRKVKCPSCDHVFVVQSPEVAEDPLGPNLANFGAPGDLSPATYQQMVKRPARRLDGSLAPPISDQPTRRELYERSGGGSRRLRPAKIDLSSIIRTVWALTLKNFGALILINLFISAAFYGWIGLVIYLEVREFDPLIVSFVNFTIYILLVVLNISYSKMCLEIARKGSAKVLDIDAAGRYLLPLLGASLIFTMALIVLMILLALISVPFWAIQLVLPITGLFYMPIYWLIIDEKDAVVNSFGTAFSILLPNILPCILLWIASLILSIFAIITGPFVIMTWAVTYLKMTNQRSFKV